MVRREWGIRDSKKRPLFEIAIKEIREMLQLDREHEAK
jgi:hypothetical protein